MVRGEASRANPSTVTLIHDIAQADPTNGANSNPNPKEREVP